MVIIMNPNITVLKLLKNLNILQIPDDIAESNQNYGNSVYVYSIVIYEFNTKQQLVP